ncbi:hypothetical protein [Halobacteriovorax marinus]|uniref:hypothetical protein n=1 Tax=Halobacteriovorax marinus TaxID=97084 RepID=UPI003A8FEC18
MKKNLLVFGAGNLGEKVGCLWKERYPESSVFAITHSKSKHSVLMDKGLIPLLGSDELPKASHIIFSIPPKDDYLDLIKRALECWDRVGNFLFISSSSIYLENNSGIVNEESPIDHEHRLAGPENLVVNNSGIILRLSGLYDQVRGPHIYLKNKMKLNSSRDSFLNLIHTLDAAKLAVNVLVNGQRGFRYLGCDSNPITKDEFSKIVLGEESKNVVFANESSTGKRCDNSWTRDVLSWQPMWPSFKTWFQS